MKSGTSRDQHRCREEEAMYARFFSNKDSTLLARFDCPFYQRGPALLYSCRFTWMKLVLVPPSFLKKISSSSSWAKPFLVTLSISCAAVAAKPFSGRVFV